MACLACGKVNTQLRAPSDWSQLQGATRRATAVSNEFPTEICRSLVQMHRRRRRRGPMDPHAYITCILGLLSRVRWCAVAAAKSYLSHESRYGSLTVAGLRPDAVNLDARWAVRAEGGPSLWSLATKGVGLDRPPDWWEWCAKALSSLKSFSGLLKPTTPVALSLPSALP